MITYIKKTFAIFLITFALALGAGTIGCQNAEADYEAGVRAIEAGDYKTALQQLRSPAEQNHPQAQAALAELYYRGQGTARNAQEAAKWYQLAANQGHVDAQVTLGWMYNAGTGIPQDITEAIKWFQLAAKQGHPGAQNNLAVLYRQGRRGHQNVEQALTWFRKAAEQGVASAQYALGQMYLNGEGVEQNVEAAVQFHTQAANQGLLEAQADLGFLYAKRENKVPQDFLIAYQWLTLSTEQGDKIAKHDLGKLLETMSSEQIQKGDQLVQEWKQKHPRNTEN